MSSFQELHGLFLVLQYLFLDPRSFRSLHDMNSPLVQGHGQNNDYPPAGGYYRNSAEDILYN